MSKTALIGFSEQLAIELHPHGVTVFAIHPGTVRTAMVEQAAQDPIGTDAVGCERGHAGCVADLIQFLASGRADKVERTLFFSGR